MSAEGYFHVFSVEPYSPKEENVKVSVSYNQKGGGGGQGGGNECAVPYKPDEWE